MSVCVGVCGWVCRCVRMGAGVVVGVDLYVGGSKFVSGCVGVGVGVGMGDGMCVFVCV